MNTLSNNDLKAIPQEISIFFAHYCASFNQLNAAAIADCYATPSGIAQAGEYFHLADQAAILTNMQTLCAHYQSIGFDQARFSILHYLPQGDQHAFVRLQWQIDLTNNQAPQQFATDYNLIKTLAGWRIALCTAFAEKFS